MIDSLLGVELPLPVKLIVAFVIVLGLIALATWVFRRLGGDRVGPSVARGRQPRLAVIDAASVDGRRRLVLVRRDNVEHLIMIGGPADIVIEQNIVRAVPVGAAPPRPAAEPTVRPVPDAAPPRAPVEAFRERNPEPPPRPRLEPLPRSQRPEQRREPAELPRPRVSPARRPEPDFRRDADAPQVDVHQAPPMADAGLADMATKLEAALRRSPPRAEPEAGPVLQGPTPPTVPSAEPAGPPKPPAPPSAKAEPAAANPQPPAAREEKPAASAPASSAPGKSMFDSLEEEMASLLGRPPGKQ